MPVMIDIYYRPRNHEGAFNSSDATYCYKIKADTVSTFSNFKNGERVAGLTGQNANGDWKRFRFENIVRLSGI
jgi:hypothetical protein|tara:strand:- start:168 stop:386 length:219 start_codon:yes stop_codon:yes gene_type:complete